MNFICNVCGSEVHDCPIEQLDREIRSCSYCGSTVRMRSIVHLLSIALFDCSKPLPLFHADKHIVGLGMSDWEGYARPLAAKFAYTNTLFHCEPFFDVTAGAGSRAGTCDFVISSDVFEHVAPPVERAFTGVFDLLKPGGHLIFSVPYTTSSRTIEHFPDLHDYRIIRFDNDHVLVNRTKDGRYELCDDLVFHGGPGTTLEMRIFCLADLEEHFSRAGFGSVRVFGADTPEFGIVHRHPWSLPILATK